MKRPYIFIFFLLMGFNLLFSREEGLRFIENKGQWPESVGFKSVFGNGSVFLEKDRFTYVLRNPEDASGIHDAIFNNVETTVRGHAFSAVFEGAGEVTTVTGLDKQPEYMNYFIGNDPQKWGSRAGVFNAVKYRNLYPGIDMDVYSAGANLKYDLVVHPGADPARFRVAYYGLDSIYLKNNQLVLETIVGDLHEMIPLAYQLIGDEKKKIDCRFRLENDVIGFDFPEGYNSSFELVIDPVLVFSTYSGSNGDNWGANTTYDDEGFLYSCSIAVEDGYPITLGAFQQVFIGATTNFFGDMAITKFDTTGSFPIWSTYLGGNRSDWPLAALINSQKELLVMGITTSTDFPVLPNAIDTSYNGNNDNDICLSKINSDGTVLINSTYIGGSNNDGYTNLTLNAHQIRTDIELDEQDSIIIIGSTQSNDFPVTPGAFQSTLGGFSDMILMKIDPDMQSIVWSTYFGRSLDDIGNDIQLDSAGNIYFCGATSNDSLPVSPGAYQTNFLPNPFNVYAYDGMIGCFNRNGTVLKYFSYYGTDQVDLCHMLDIDDVGMINVTGYSRGQMPVTPGTYFNQDGKNFISRFSPDLTQLQVSTVIGTGTVPNLVPSAFNVDHCGNFYLAGFLGMNGAEMANLPTTPDAFTQQTDGEDFYLGVLTKDLQTLRYGTFFGGTVSFDHTHSLNNRFDKKGVLYHSNCASCGGFSDVPTTPGAWSSTNNGSNGNSNGCNLAVFKFDFELWDIQADFSYTQTILCTGDSIHFFDNSVGGLNFTWDFGDGNTGTGTDIYNIYQQPGAYSVQLIVDDPANCSPPDTVIKTIVVNPSPTVSAGPDQTICAEDSVLLSCTNGYLFEWSPSTYVSDSSVQNPVAFPPFTTDFVVQTWNQIGCSHMDTVRVNVIQLPTINIEQDTSICRNTPVSLVASGADSILWNTGDTAAMITVNPQSDMYYWAIPTSNGCQGHPDTVLVTVFPDLPEAVFEPSDTTGFVPLEVFFNNLSQNASAYFWDFGDPSSTSVLQNPSFTYTEPGQYVITLLATDDNGCRDSTYYRFIEIGPDFALYIPNAFTPNGDGINDCFLISHYGIVDFNISIFDRWGKEIYLSDDPDFCWNGQYQGTPLPEGTYTFVLTAKGFEMNEIQRTGTVMLLR